MPLNQYDLEKLIQNVLCIIYSYLEASGGCPPTFSPTQDEQINTTFTDKHTIHEVLKCELSAFPLTLQFQTQRTASEHETKEDLHIAMYPRSRNCFGDVLVNKCYHLVQWRFGS